MGKENGQERNEKRGMREREGLRDASNSLQRAYIIEAPFEPLWLLYCKKSIKNRGLEKIGE